MHSLNVALCQDKLADFDSLGTVLCNRRTRVRAPFCWLKNALMSGLCRLCHLF